MVHHIPAIEGRKERIKAFIEYIEKHRRELRYRRLLAKYSLESGIRVKTLEAYFNLLKDADLYFCDAYSNWMIVNKDEYKNMKSQHK